MKKINVRDIPDSTWDSPRGKFGGSGKEISIALGRNPDSADFNNRHPFDIELCTIPPGKTPCPFHSHSAQWEFYHILSGFGLLRDSEGITPIGAGDVVIFPPGEPHQLINNGSENLVVYLVADNPRGESCYYPDSKKWLVRSPERQLIRSASLDYHDGEE